jgi:amicyanin
MMKVLFVLALFVLAACQNQPVLEPERQVILPPPQPYSVGNPAAVEVAIEKFAYSPQEVRIKVGDTVRWTQVDKVQHTVTVVSGPESFDSGLLNAGQTFEHTFTQPGTYDYICTPHPKMRGKVVVV